MVEAGPVVRLTAELRTVGGERLAQATADGEADSILSLVDTLSFKLLREIWRARTPVPDLRVSAITTGSLQAVRAYLQGEQYYRRSQWDSAAAFFGAAIDADSAFALALLRMGQTIGWLRGHGSPLALWLGETAARQADRLPLRERELVVANRLFQQGRLAALDTLRAYIARYPEDAEGWYQYGTVQYEARHLIAVTPQELYAPFDRVHELDASLTPALIRAVELTLEEGDSVRFARRRGFDIQIRTIPVRDPDRWIGMVRVTERRGSTVDINGGVASRRVPERGGDSTAAWTTQGASSTLGWEPDRVAAAARAIPPPTVRRPRGGARARAGCTHEYGLNPHP